MSSVIGARHPVGVCARCAVEPFARFAVPPPWSTSRRVATGLRLINRCAYGGSMSPARWALSHSSDPDRTAQAHEALKSDAALFERLAFGGFLEGVGAVYELRICPACETALSLPADAARILRVHAAVARITAASLEAVLAAQTRSPLRVRLAALDSVAEPAAPVPRPVAVEESVCRPLATAAALHAPAS